jgi:hypothetical protein
MNPSIDGEILIPGSGMIWTASFLYFTLLSLPDSTRWPLMPKGRHWLLVRSMESRDLFSYLSYRRHPGRSRTVRFEFVLIWARRFLRAGFVTTYE